MSNYPNVQFCPYCGSDQIYYKMGTNRCYKCRSVFFVQFSRFMRKAPSYRVGVVDKLVAYIKRHDGMGVLLNAEC